MSTRLTMLRDSAGKATYILPACQDLMAGELIKDVAQSITVPDNHAEWMVLFAYETGAEVWVDVTGATAAYPTGAFAATTSEHLPVGKWLKAGDSISFKTPDDATNVGVSFYAVS